MKASDLDRRGVLLGLAALGVAGPAMAQAPFGVDYLEALAAPGRLPADMAYLAPSALDPSYTHAIYVNTATRSEAGQKMWVIARDGSGWALALWDAAFWEGHDGPPPYSWPVSTGRHYTGNRRSGPTPLGIFNVDERDYRHRKGWGGEDMYNSIYIDLHYRGGRRSGVAMHGTTRSRYRHLGRAESHGCVRMRQENADLVWRMFHGQGRPGRGSPLWSEAVPRYFTSVPKGDWSNRFGYVRDGSFLQDASGARLTKAGYAAVFVFFRDDL